jgi:hypothetical protein
MAWSREQSEPPSGEKVKTELSMVVPRGTNCRVEPGPWCELRLQGLRSEAFCPGSLLTSVPRGTNLKPTEIRGANDVPRETSCN